jgi:PAS domain S-box-containing protein
MKSNSFFESIFQQSETNAVLVMTTEGIVIEVNKAFTKHYGYTSEDLAGKSFTILFTKSDREKHLPKKELTKVNSTGQSSDDNYVVDKLGNYLRSSGESILVTTDDGEKLIVKLIINLHAKKYLRMFFSETEKLLHETASHSTEVPLMVLDGSMKVLETNVPFRKFFDIEEKPKRGIGLSTLHPFWKRDDVKQLIRSIIVGNEPIKRKRFDLKTSQGEKKKITIDAKTIEGSRGNEKKVFIMVDGVDLM